MSRTLIVGQLALSLVLLVAAGLFLRLWPDGDAVGRTFRFLGNETTIVGIARDAKYATLNESTPAFTYFPVAQVWQPAQALLVRTATPPEQLGRAHSWRLICRRGAPPRPIRSQPCARTDAAVEVS